MKTSHKKKPEQLTNIAKERINKLFEEAEDNIKEHPELSRRYVELARKIAMKYKVKFSKDQKMSSCKKCNAYLRQGVNCSTRLAKGIIVIRCKECNNLRRLVYKK